MIESMDTRLLISRYAKEGSSDLVAVLIEALEKKDDRFKKMGMYYPDERLSILRREIDRSNV
jgi:hypothetical protein